MAYPLFNQRKGEPRLFTTASEGEGGAMPPEEPEKEDAGCAEPAVVEEVRCTCSQRSAFTPSSWCKVFSHFLLRGASRPPGGRGGRAVFFV